MSKLLSTSKDSVTVAMAAKAWEVTSAEASKALARLASAGWLARVRRGLYVPVPLDASTPDAVIEDAWLVAQRLFQPCYIGGWSAAEYWGLTEQVFNTVVVITTRRPRQRTVKAAGVEFRVKSVLDKAMFGTQEVWRNNVKVPVSSPAKTIVDLLDDPGLGGGIRPALDIFTEYQKSKHFSADDLAAACKQFDSGAVFKRLGFILEKNFPQEKVLIELCKANLSKGNAKLDPDLTCPRLSTRWRLWIPENWKEPASSDR